ncbi:MAG TPA: hypothetical protein EYQ74_01365 [Planctomycetes bacterium]|nr:hypothetical protein [Planctomycetota bacterium]HIK61925.1 hypothetical protein [Planctomycetota bacterium]
MLSSFRLCTLTLAAIAGLASPTLAADAPFMDLALPDAIARAQKEKRVLVLFFDSKDAPDARRMLERTWPDEAVAAWLKEKAIAIQVPASDTKMKQRYAISWYPQTFLINPDGMHILHKIEGHATPTELIIGMSASLLGSSQQTRPGGDDSEKPLAWMAFANYLFTNDPGRSIECLDAYLWCLDHGEDHIDGFRTYYLEFLLQRIAYLRSYTTKATEALLSRRGRWRAAIIAGVSTEEEIQEYLRFCFWLRDEVDVLDAVVEMRNLGDDQELASRTLLRAELNRAVGRKLYGDILRLDPSPLQIIDARLSTLHKTPLEQRTKSGDFFDERLAIITDASCYFEALLASSRAGDAFTLVDRVVKDAPTGVTFRAFMERTNRLRIYSLTERLAKQGLEMVGDRGKKHILSQVNLIKTLKAQDERKAALEEAKRELDPTGDGDQN